MPLAIAARDLDAYNSTVIGSSSAVVLGERALTIHDIARVARDRVAVTIHPRAHDAMARSRAVIASIVAAGDDAPAVYGVNTGFGALAEVRISSQQIAQLQRNLVRSHIAGVGERLSAAEVRAMMLLRAAVLSRGHSGARPEICQRLCDLLNHGIHPHVPARGSVGASGDLAPLAHLAGCLIGESTVEFGGVDMPAARALAENQLDPIDLEAKEGLTLLNGTQHMTGVGALALVDAEDTCRLADLAGAMSLEALMGTSNAFDERVLGARPHPGQLLVGQILRRLLADSSIAESHRFCGRVQDAYSLRCMPQVHGASRDTLAFARQVIEREANATTDNPLVFVDPDQPFGGELISGGNFHGQPVAIALDSASIAVAELASISERRVEQLVNPSLSNGLPAFLAQDSGLNSGYMIAQVTAAALVSENKVLAHPASVDSIPTSAGREDHVSMGALAAIKLRQIVNRVRTVLAIELLCASQGLDFREPLRPGPLLAAAHTCVRKHVPTMLEDRHVAPDIARIRALIDSGELLAAVPGL